MDGIDERYSRNIPALSPEECAALRSKRVCVAGCGGLGGYIIELLARAGAGELVVADGDVFDVSNLNRQLFSKESNIGQKKARAAALRVAEINSGVKVISEEEMFTAESGPRLLKGCDLALDALDSAEARLTLARACNEAGICLVHGAISGWFAQVTVIAPGSGTMEKLYPPKKNKPPSRGNLGFVASVCAAIQVSEAVKLLCGRESELSGKLLIMDLKTPDFTKIDI
ncbi:MAG: HesA/MoeB/ThiF family protein [Oscillospiraceae bacterium]|nr:HesA/MoeB/ThiF family protein [Oscillospiraceae bacterium]